MAPSREQLVEFVSLYRLATASAVARRFSASRSAAVRWMRAAARDGVLCIHRVEHDNGRHTQYVSLRRRPYTPSVFQPLYSVVWYSLLSPVYRPMLNRQQYRRLVRQTHGRHFTRIPYQPCFIDRTREGLSLLQAARPGVYRSLGQAISDLERRVARPDFAPWLPFVANGQCAITYLIAGPERVAELRHWLDRRPLVVRTDAHCGVVPVLVDETRLP